jgi:small subunit ribosomal protein S16
LLIGFRTQKTKTMSVKIRLQRHGKKGKPFFHIVAADARSPRDGKFIERIGSYNPNTNPATIDLDNAKALSWLQNGAQPTETARAILSYRGVLYRLHLQKGVLKGALTQEEADQRWADWNNGKESKIQSKRDGLAQAKASADNETLKRERAINEARLQAISQAAAEAAAAEVVEEVVEEAPAAAETVETTEEAPAVEVAVETVETVETTEEAPAAEAAAPTEEAPAENAGE